MSLTYRATVDISASFRKSKSVGAVFGSTCAKYQSGEVDWDGRISRCGDEMMRTMFCEAAQAVMRSKRWSHVTCLPAPATLRCERQCKVCAARRHLHRLFDRRTLQVVAKNRYATALE